jgi:hypothetical protein
MYLITSRRYVLLKLPLAALPVSGATKTALGIVVAIGVDNLSSKCSATVYIDYV